MALRLVQFRDQAGGPALAALEDSGRAVRLAEVEDSYALARRALAAGERLEAAARALFTDESVDLAAAAAEGRLRAPIEHPDPAHMMLSGTGLTHLGSAEGRNKMHQAAAGGTMTDSMRMFNMGLEGGKPEAGAEGVQPEWFYKGDGSSVVATGEPLGSPDFALDAGEEPEIAGIYIIDDAGNPRRLGFALANEFSDHVTERGNYLWLAHSKLRPAALGAEMLLGDLPEDIRGTSRIRRGDEILWEQPFLTGEANMSHSLANLERHHFKYGLFRRPGDVHVHFFGTATLSFSEGIQTRAGDVFEIEAPPFLLPLRSPIGTAPAARHEISAL